MIKNLLSLLFFFLAFTFITSCIEETIDPDDPTEVNEDEENGDNDSEDTDEDDGTEGNGDEDNTDDEEEDTTSTGVWLEADRLLVMEAENTRSDLGNWRSRSRFDGYSGDGYLQFVGNSPTNGDADSPLVYEFKIENAGVYRLEIHTSRDPGDVDIRNDYSNDAYIRVEGDYEDAPNRDDYAPYEYLSTDTKYYTGFPENSDGSASLKEWHFASHMNPGEGQYLLTWYTFKAGETYKLVISGRSKFYIIDRIVFSGGYSKSDRRSITEESERE